MTTQKMILHAVGFSLIACGGVGVYIFLFGELGWVQARILLTTLTISALSICSLACESILEKKRKVALAKVGILCALITSGLIIYAIWQAPTNKQFWQITFSLITISIAISHICLLSHANLAGKYEKYRLFTDVSIYFLTGLVISMFWETRWSPEFYFKSIGICSILVAILTLLTPLFHKSSKEYRGHTSSKNVKSSLKSKTGKSRR